MRDNSAKVLMLKIYFSNMKGNDTWLNINYRYWNTLNLGRENHHCEWGFDIVKKKKLNMPGLKTHQY